MSDFFDAIMDLTFEHETPSWALLQECLAALPDRQPEVWGFFREWLFQDWIDANAPAAPDPTPEQEAETQRWIDESVKKLLAALDKERNSRVLH